MKWQLDLAHTNVEAAAKHMMFTTVRVRFPGASGEIDLDRDRPEKASIRLGIPVASLTSGDERRDAHLRSADFFDAEHHPEIEFRSTKVEPTGQGRFTVAGDLAIRGITKPVTVEVELQGIGPDPMDPNRQRAFIDAKTRIDRREWGLVWNMPVPQGVLVSHDIALEFSTEAISQAPVSQAA